MAKRRFGSGLAMVWMLAFGPLLVGADGCDGYQSVVVPVGTPCGLDVGDCGDDQYCRYAGDLLAEGQGTCTERPDLTACTEEYAPVCGNDGQTYSNACFAAAAGVSVATVGECPAGASCGGFAGLACDAGEYCDFGVGQCQLADGLGSCRPMPNVCPGDYAPVCGCDGQTYSNRCHAASAGMSIDHDGACGTSVCEPSDCGPEPASPIPHECLPSDAAVSPPECVWTPTCYPPACAAPPPGCHYEGGGGCSCGTLVCDDQCALVDCAAPPPGCEYVPDGSCCGALSCPPPPVCEPSDCGPEPASPIPHECLPSDAAVSPPECVWTPTCYPPPCAAPPYGCHYEGATACTCGTLVCPEPQLCDAAECGPVPAPTVPFVCARDASGVCNWTYPYPFGSP